MQKVLGWLIVDDVKILLEKGIIDFEGRRSRKFFALEKGLWFRPKTNPTVLGKTWGFWFKGCVNAGRYGLFAPLQHLQPQPKGL
jgi:hypothetical protein